MNINEVNQTYFLISRPNTDNLMWFLLFSFLLQRDFIFIMKKYLYIWPLNVMCNVMHYFGKVIVI